MSLTAHTYLLLPRLYLLLSLLLLGPAAQCAQEELPVLVERLRSQSDLPALGAALVRVGQPPEVVVAGTRRRGEAVPVTAADQWHLGSDTKAMTAVLVAQLVEKKTPALGQHPGRALP